MKTSLLLFLVVLGFAGTSCSKDAAEPPEAAAPQETSGTIWKATLIPCKPYTCGFPQNTATFQLESGEVLVGSDGVVRIRLRGLSKENQVAAFKTLEVHLGSFSRGEFEGYPFGPLGKISTDIHGNFDGTVKASYGRPFTFTRGTSISSNFALNDPGVRTEFVTGFLVP